METNQFIKDLYKKVENKDWLYLVYLACHLIRNCNSTQYNILNDNTEDLKIIDIIKGQFDEPAIVCVITQIITVYCFSDKDLSDRRLKKYAKIDGYNTEIKITNKKDIIDSLFDNQKDLDYLPDNQFEIIYFPYCKPGSKNEFFLFKEISRNKFSIDDISDKVELDDKENIREGVSKRFIFETILKDIYGDK